MSRVPAVSVILPTYNRASLLVAAVTSVLGQSFADLELIVVDDGSTDETESVVRGIGDGRVRYLRHESRQGGGAARNTGIAAARGSLVAFQDSDNEWLPDKLEKQMEVLALCGKEVGVVYTGCWRIKNGRKTYLPYRRIGQREGDLHEALLRENFLDTPSLLVRRECFLTAGGFDSELPRFQDWELCLRLSRHYQFRFVDEPLYLGHYQKDSISANGEAALQALKHIYRKYLPEISRDPGLLAHYQHWLGLCCTETGRRSEAFPFFLKAVGTEPANVKYWVSLVLGTLSPGALTRLVALYQSHKNAEITPAHSGK